MFFIKLIIILTKLVVITRIMYKQYARIKMPDFGQSGSATKKYITYPSKK